MKPGPSRGHPHKQEARKSSATGETSLSRLLQRQTLTANTRKKNLSFVQLENGSNQLELYKPLKLGYRRKASVFLTVMKIFKLILEMLDFMGLFKLMQL